MFDTFMKEKNCRVDEIYRKDKTRTAKIYSEVDRSKEKNLKNDNDEFIYFFYKDSLKDLMLTTILSDTDIIEVVLI